MKIEEIYALPINDNGWRKLPNGNYVTLGGDVTLGDGVPLGDGVTLGDGVKLGNYVTLGDGVTLGNYVKLGNYVTLGDGVTLGGDVTLGDGVKLGNYVTLGDGVTLGNYVTDVIDLGFCEGYRKAIAVVKGVAYIAAGCRWFTLHEAILHWQDRKEDRPITRIMIVSAIKIAKLKGWKLK